MALKLSFDNMSAREQNLLKYGGVAAVLILIFGVLIPLNSSVASAKTRVAKKQADLVWMRSVAPVLAASAPMHQPGAGGESLIVIVDRSARESGLGSSLAGTDPSPGGIQVRIEKASFDAMIGWLSRLSQQNGVGVDGASIDQAGTPGLVNAAIVLKQQ